jgi:hypothetical protein
MLFRIIDELDDPEGQESAKQEDDHNDDQTEATFFSGRQRWRESWRGHLAERANFPGQAK